MLLIVAILFLRNQIRPILRLADAAESFGKGREVPSFRPRGALEVRRAAHAFIEMKTRIERAMEQRTAMLAGVSHDLRTILTRFKLELALIDDNPEIDAMKKDVDEMARMLEAYLAFARGDFGETSSPTDMAMFLDDLKAESERNGHRTTVVFHGPPVVTVRPAAFKRCVDNLVSNAARHARSISITGHRDHRWLSVTVDDDGPGIPVAMREEVFKPFLRLDDARNQNEGGTGLGKLGDRTRHRGARMAVNISSSSHPQVRSTRGDRAARGPGRGRCPRGPGRVEMSAAVSVHCSAPCGRPAPFRASASPGSAARPSAWSERTAGLVRGSAVSRRRISTSNSRSRGGSCGHVGVAGLPAPRGRPRGICAARIAQGGAEYSATATRRAARRSAGARSRRKPICSNRLLGEQRHERRRRSFRGFVLGCGPLGRRARGLAGHGAPPIRSSLERRL